jgi:hypothetical protein
MKRNQQLALALSCVPVAITWYAIALDSDSGLGPASFILQAALVYAQFFGSGIDALLALSLLAVRKDAMYMVPLAASLLALVRALLLWL